MWVTLWVVSRCLACAASDDVRADGTSDQNHPSAEAAVYSEGDAQAPEDASAVAPSVVIGIPGGSDGLDFAPLVAGDEVRLQTFGQGGTHVLLAIRCAGFGHRAYVSLTLRNELTYVEVTSPAPPRPQLLLCRDDPAVCDLVPVLALASGLTAPGVERNGVPVRISAEVRNDEGVTASGSQQVVLSTADL